MKSLILAAGFGTRLRPITDNIPKPLVKFCGIPTLDIILAKLSNSQLTDIAINSHYLSNNLIKHLENRPNLNIHISVESEILGTGGCINPIRPWLNDDPLLIYNGDVISDIDLNRAVDEFKQKQPEAMMVLLPTCLPGKNPVCMEGNTVISIGHEKIQDSQRISKHTFTGVHIISQKFIQTLAPSGSYSIIETYKKIIRDGGTIIGFVHNGFWHDLGSPKGFLEAHIDMVDKDILSNDNTGISAAVSLFGHRPPVVSATDGLPSITDLEPSDLPSTIKWGSNTFVFGSRLSGPQNISVSNCIVNDYTNEMPSQNIDGALLYNNSILPIQLE